MRRALEEQGTHNDVQGPRVFIGPIASGDTVMKSGEDRDKIAESLNLIAFEMEASGIWGELPCLVVKGVCDYADSHKDKKWQKFAAAIAAAAMKALLERYIRTDELPSNRYRELEGWSGIASYSENHGTDTRKHIEMAPTVVNSSFSPMHDRHCKFLDMRKNCTLTLADRAEFYYSIRSEASPRNTA